MKEEKIRKVRAYMKENGIDGVIVSSWQNVLYLSGFTGYGDARLLVTATEAFLITDSRYYVQAAEQAPEFELVKERCDAPGAMKKLLAEHGVKSVGYENQAVSYADYCGYYRELGAELCEIGDLFCKMRLIKNEAEIAAIERACDLASEALVQILPEIRPGKTELEVAALLEYRMRVLGADKPSFDTIIASGARGAMPHGTATAKKIESGDGVTVDFGAFYGGVCSDMTRTFFVGEPGEKMREIYRVVLEAQQAVTADFREGMTGREVDAIARKVITEAGYGEFFGHGLGHGVGIDIHEAPTVSTRGEAVLLPGMVFSNEPGIYVPGVGGVRIEDLVMIRDGRLYTLTKSPAKELTVL